ncbi:hypothetical protein Hanom_Chr17g01577881 [Helianthus anomalus]
MLYEQPLPMPKTIRLQKQTPRLLPRRLGVWCDNVVALVAMTAHKNIFGSEKCLKRYARTRARARPDSARELASRLELFYFI